MRWLKTMYSNGIPVRRFLILSVSSLLVLLLAGCGNDDNGVEPRRVYDVVYSLNITGESTVDQVTYTVGGKDVTLSNPTDGWSIEIEAGDGHSVGASAQGTVKNGEIVLFMRATSAGKSPITRIDECSESAGTPTICSLDIPKVTLPK
ncbi:MAG: hypothetical protein KAJ17_11125 [Candidatus Krumholzibacteria bacterium]|nr:hypothetical protein [Candidatus Krumholzibacteria bacterium]